MTFMHRGLTQGQNGEEFSAKTKMTLNDKSYLKFNS